MFLDVDKTMSNQNFAPPVDGNFALRVGGQAANLQTIFCTIKLANIRRRQTLDLSFNLTRENPLARDDDRYDNDPEKGEKGGELVVVVTH